METLSTVVEDRIWVAERPVWFSGVRLRARTTILRLEDGGLWVHSPAPPSPALDTALEALGPVRWLVIPNVFHHLGASEAAGRYPEATVVGPAAARAKRPELAFEAFEEGAPIPAELERLPLEGVPFLDESLFFHEPTGTLIGSDFVMSAGPKDHWTWRLAGRITGRWGKVRTPPDVQWKTPRSAAAAEAIRRVAERPIRRVLVAHADPIEDEPAERLREAWRFVHP
ncbi:MAG: DUF4336 domain-containing protein [Myxococcales bacterium]|nr:DUF4336 domain-containing protein [Myxococcales bacterium]